VSRRIRSWIRGTLSGAALLSRLMGSRLQRGSVRSANRAAETRTATFAVRSLRGWQQTLIAATRASGQRRPKIATENPGNGIRRGFSMSSRVVLCTRLSSLLSSPSPGATYLEFIRRTSSVRRLAYRLWVSMLSSPSCWSPRFLIRARKGRPLGGRQVAATHLLLAHYVLRRRGTLAVTARREKWARPRSHETVSRKPEIAANRATDRSDRGRGSCSRISAPGKMT
jgi:hypothetical protein